MMNIIQNLENLPWIISSFGGFGIGGSLLLGLLKFPGGKIIGVVSLCLSTFSAGVMWSNNKEELKASNARIEHLEQLLTQRDGQYKRLSQQALNRAEANVRLSGIIEQYETELQNGQAIQCKSDPVYTNRLRSILQGLPGTTSN